MGPTLAGYHPYRDLFPSTAQEPPVTQAMAFTQALATTLALLAGILPHSLRETLDHKKANGDRCVHHTHCLSDCCLIDLEKSGAFCTSKSRMGMACLPQTKGALNIMCPCRVGLSCHSKDPMCPRRCQMI